MGEASSTGKTRGYAVEVRSIAPHPEALFGMLLDERWQRIPVALTPESRADEILNMLDLVNYADAESLRWKMHSYHLSAICVETRIVEFDVVYSIEAKRVSEYCVLGMRDIGRPKKQEGL